MGSPPVKGFGQGDPALAAWAEGVYAPEDEVLAEIRTRCDRAGLPKIAVGRFDGLHLEILANDRRQECRRDWYPAGTAGRASCAGWRKAGFFTPSS